MTSHAGLNFRPDDYKFVVDLAFNTDNPSLWGVFIARHMFHHSDNVQQPVNTLRRHMRDQASEKPSLMRVWAKTNREARQLDCRDRKYHISSRRRKNNQSRHDSIHAENIKFAKENRALVESGCHWGYLKYFTDLVLRDSDETVQAFDDEDLVKSALRNSINFITQYIPSLLELAQMKCASRGARSVDILYAACLEILREQGNLEGIKPELLKALRTNMDMHYGGVNQEDRGELKNEVDRLLFPDAKSADEFLREYIEPQLAQTDCNHPHVWLLRSEEIFSASRAGLSMEWLKRYPELALQTLDTLFEIAAQYANRDDLEKLISERCAEYIRDWPNQTDNEKIEERRIFWFVRAWYFLKDTPEIYWNWLKADKDTIFILNHKSGRINRTDHPYWPQLTSSKVEAILDAFIEKWPKVELPSSWGTGDPEEQVAYRFLTETIWLINSDEPEEAIPVLNRLIADQRFTHLHKSLKSILAIQSKARVLRNFEPPLPSEIVDLLDRNRVVTVEGLRKLLLQELNHYQDVINGGEYNDANRFYEQGKHLNENDCTEIVAGYLNLRLEPQAISITPEHQLHASKRSDFTATKLIDGKRRLLVTEVKGQWHKELYSAASTQLNERYAIHPDAEQQGIYLVIWFGSNEKVAGRKNYGIGNAQELKSAIEARLPSELIGRIDVFVLDVSNPPGKRNHKSI